MLKLAINGGEKIRKHKFPAYITVGEEEKRAVMKVVESGVLSKFLGSWHEDFYGGSEVRAFESEWADYFNVKHAIAVNSATSALYCAVGAAGIGPGDEVIVSPYTMTASAIAPLIYNAIPIFADIEEDYFCLAPESVKEQITERTKAIIVVDLFGQSYNADQINSVAAKHDLVIIEDCAQAPGAKYKGKWAGTLGDIGLFSLNYHKHIHTGEGGVLVTNNDELAEKLRLIRNHSEAVVEPKGHNDLVNMIGFNYRMTEIEATIGREQLKKLSSLLKQRLENVMYLSKELAKIPCIESAKVRPESEHAFYVHPIKYNKEKAGIPRNRFVEAVKAELALTELRETEGVKVSAGYTKPLYLQPIYQNKIAFGDLGCPWTCEKYKGNAQYYKGICPVAERINEDELILHELIRPPMTKEDLDDVVGAFNKVWENLEELR